MRLCKNHGELPDDSFFVRSSGFCPHLCRVCERDRAKLRRRARYADPAERARILAQNTKSRTRAAVPKVVVPDTPALLEEIRRHSLIPALKETPAGIFEKLQKVPLTSPLVQNLTGINYLDNMFVHRNDARTDGLPSLNEMWASDRDIIRTVQYIVGTGRYPKPEIVVRNLKFNCLQPSHFFPSAAASIFQEFGVGRDCYDPFAGWGGRALGALCSGVASLVSTDLQQKSVDQCTKMAEHFADISAVKTEFRHADFSQFMEQTDRRFDFIFTSPPFVSTEDYGLGKSASFREWTNKIVLPLVDGARRVLKPGGKVAIHAQDRKGMPVLSTFMGVFLAAGFRLESEYKYGRKEGQKVIVYACP